MKRAFFRPKPRIMNGEVEGTKSRSVFFVIVEQKEAEETSNSPER